MMTLFRRQADSAWSWLVCLASFISLTINHGSYYSFGLLLPSLMEQFQRSSATTAWSGSLYLALSYTMGLLTIYLCERFNFRVTAVGGSLLAAAGFFLSSFANNFWLFFVMFSIPTGAGSASSYNCSILVVLKYFVKWRALAVGITASSSSVGMFVMSQITEALLSKYGWRVAVRGWAGLFLLAAICACTYDPSVGMQEHIDESEDPEQGDTNQHRRRENYSTILRNAVFVVYLSSASLVLFSSFASTIFLVQFMESQLGIPEEKSAIIYTYMGIALFFSNHVFCKLSHFRINIFHLFQFSMTVYGVGLLLLPLARTYTALVACYVVFGVMDGGRVGLMPLLVVKCVGRGQTDRAWGVLSFCIGLSSAVGPVVIGFTADLSGSYKPAFQLAGAIMLTGASVTLLTMCFRKSNQVEPSVPIQNDDYGKAGGVQSSQVDRTQTILSNQTEPKGFGHSYEVQLTSSDQLY